MPIDTAADDGVDDTNDEDEHIHEQLLWPLRTNLTQTPIAGPGLCLHFNFFAAILVWAAVIIYLYALAACMVSIDMLVLGLTPAKTPVQLCAVIHWGHDAQMRTIWAKAQFTLVAYLVTFLGCIYLGIYQRRAFHRLDEEVTMKDFVAVVTGLPAVKGEDSSEEDLKRFFEDQVHQKVHGVSICWDYTAKLKDVHEAIEADWKERETQLAPPPPSAEEESVDPTPRQNPGFLRRQFRKLDSILLGALGVSASPTTPSEEGAAGANEGAPTEAASTEGVDIVALLREMESSDMAFVVFDTEVARDTAVENVQLKHGLEYKGSTLQLETRKCEPATARFSGLCYGSGYLHRAKKMFRATVITIVSLLIWICVFYAPYAYYTMSYSYANGEKPSFVAATLFSLLVVAGNQSIYFLADMLSVQADFAFDDAREVAYNYIYVTACVLNTIADIALTLYLAYRTMVGLGVHTSDDRMLEDLTTFADIFESYPVQKAFGDLLYIYCFPSCFAFPFFCECFCTITVPYYVGKYLVLSHDEIQCRQAELALTYFLPMNLGRYGDIILNMILSCLVFLCPGGFTLPIFIAFLICHFFVYVYDHCRILRCTPNFYYADSSVDFFGQMQLILPTGTLASIAAFRVAQQTMGVVINGPILYTICSVTFAVHCVVHWIALRHVCPMFARLPPHVPSKRTYSDVAKTCALTWFSANPVHCLRSKHIHDHSPPIIHCIYGKEHLQQENPAIGAFFEDESYGGAYQMSGIKGDEEKEARQEFQDENDEQMGASNEEEF
jgi:hypothetical protein